MVLPPLEFSAAQHDAPHLRKYIQQYEKCTQGLQAQLELFVETSNSHLRAATGNFNAAGMLPHTQLLWPCVSTYAHIHSISLIPNTA